MGASANRSLLTAHSVESIIGFMSLLGNLGNAIIGALDLFGEGIQGTINNAASDLGSLHEDIQEQVQGTVDGAAKSLDRVNAKLEEKTRSFQGRGRE